MDMVQILETTQQQDNAAWIDWLNKPAGTKAFNLKRIIRRR